MKVVTLYWLLLILTEQHWSVVYVFETQCLPTFFFLLGYNKCFQELAVESFIYQVLFVLPKERCCVVCFFVSYIAHAHFVVVWKQTFPILVDVFVWSLWFFLVSTSMDNCSTDCILSTRMSSITVLLSSSLPEKSVLCWCRRLCPPPSTVCQHVFLCLKLLMLLY